MDQKFWQLYNLLLNEKVSKSDAVIWLQGDRFDRAKNVLEIYKSKIANNIVITGNNVLVGPTKKAGEDNISLIEMKSFLLKNGVREKDIIVDGVAFNTKDQANHIINIARQKDWNSVILISSAYNQPRAFLTFLKQVGLSNNIRIRNFPVVMDMEKFPGGRTRTVRELCFDEINKIRKYKNDLFPLTLGIEHLKNI